MRGCHQGRVREAAVRIAIAPALAARATGGPKVERPSLPEDSGFSISHSARRFIEATADPISSGSRAVTESALPLPIRCRRSLTLAALQRWQRELSPSRKRAVPTTRLVPSRRQANPPHRDRPCSRAKDIARMLVPQFVLLSVFYVRSFEFPRSSNQIPISRDINHVPVTYSRRFIRHMHTAVRKLEALASGELCHGGV